jgi:hypothetical protein
MNEIWRIEIFNTVDQAIGVAEIDNLETFKKLRSDKTSHIRFKHIDGKDCFFAPPDIREAFETKEPKGLDFALHIIKNSPEADRVYRVIITEWAEE